MSPAFAALYTRFLPAHNRVSVSAIEMATACCNRRPWHLDLRTDPKMRIAIILLVVVVLGASGARAAERKPNILLICVDDLKPMLGCYGDTTIKSPNIDRLAARGMRFDRAYCNQAVCAPSRNALLTGLRPQTIGIYDLGTNFRRAV